MNIDSTVDDDNDRSGNNAQRDNNDRSGNNAQRDNNEELSLSNDQRLPLSNRNDNNEEGPSTSFGQTSSGSTVWWRPFTSFSSYIYTQGFSKTDVFVQISYNIRILQVMIATTMNPQTVTIFCSPLYLVHLRQHRAVQQYQAPVVKQQLAAAVEHRLAPAADHHLVPAVEHQLAAAVEQVVAIEELRTKGLKVYAPKSTIAKNHHPLNAMKKIIALCV